MIVKPWPEAQEFGFAIAESAFGLQLRHGIGLPAREKPVFSRLVSLDCPRVLAEGMVSALETFWPASDGWSAARVQEQLVVTADGCDVIARFPAADLVIARGSYETPHKRSTIRETRSHRNAESVSGDSRGGKAGAAPRLDIG